MEHVGGLDSFIMNQPNEVLSKRAMEIKTKIRRKMSKAKPAKKA